MRLDGTEGSSARLVVSPELGGRIVVRPDSAMSDVVFDRSHWDVVAGRRREPLPEPEATEPPAVQPPHEEPLPTEASAGQVVPAEAQPAGLVREVPLPALGMWLHVVEHGEGPEATRRLVVVDQRNPGAETGWTAEDRFEAGYVVTNDTGDQRWFLGPDARTEFEDARLDGTEHFVRYHADGPSIVDEDSWPVRDTYVLEPRATGLTVRPTREAEPGAITAWHFNAERMPDGTEVHPGAPSPAPAARTPQSAETPEPGPGPEPEPEPEPEATAVAAHGELSGDGHGSEAFGEYHDEDPQVAAAFREFEARHGDATTNPLFVDREQEQRYQRVQRARAAHPH